MTSGSAERTLEIGAWLLACENAYTTISIDPSKHTGCTDLCGRNKYSYLVCEIFSARLPFLFLFKLEQIV